MNTKLLIIFVVVVIALLGGYFLVKSGNMSNNSAQPSTAPTNTSKTTVPTSSATAKEVEVTLTSHGYSPTTITIASGTKVVWTNKSGTEATVSSDPHPFHTDYPPLNLGNFKDGEKLELIFNKTGTFRYHNHFNSSERGTIIVK